MVFDSQIVSPFRWPREFNGQPLFYEWTRDIAKVFELNRPNGNQLVDIHPLLGGAATPVPNVVLDNPMDMEFGPDNALYSSSTAPATSPSCPRLSWRASTTSVAASTRRSCGGPRRRPRERPRR